MKKNQMSQIALAHGAIVMYVEAVVMGIPPSTNLELLRVLTNLIQDSGLDGASVTYDMIEKYCEYRGYDFQNQVMKHIALL